MHEASPAGGEERAIGIAVPDDHTAVSDARQLDLETLTARLVNLDRAIGAEEAELGEATARGDQKAAQRAEDRLERALSDKRRVCLALDAVERIASEAAQKRAEAERKAAIEAAQRDHEAGHALTAAVDTALDDLMTALDALQGHSESMEAHRDVMDVSYWRALVPCHEARERLLQGNAALAHVLMSGPMVRNKMAVPVASTYPSFETIRLDRQAEQRHARDEQRRTAPPKPSMEEQIAASQVSESRAPSVDRADAALVAAAALKVEMANEAAAA